MLKLKKLGVFLLLRPLAVHGSEGAAVHTVNPDDWLQECFGTFIEHCCASDTDRHILYSNFNLIAKPAGLCADHLACAFAKCDTTGIELVQKKIENAPDKAALTYDQVEDDLGTLNLPSKMVFPRTVADVVAGVEYANKEGLKVSIKSTGHSYTGSSTIKDSLQLNLRDLQTYTDQSAVKCEDQEPSKLVNPDFKACALARARGKDALIKVGGGETWSNVYMALKEVVDELNTPLYEAVGGAAGSVGAAGGWLQGGGWSYGPDRRHGLGVDQVLEFEMVLADGRHVLFGPTGWEAADGFLYPKTTEVSGKCNANANDDEDQWEWVDCADPVPNFSDLWFAVRGGGGGTFGVVTSLKYQLHEQRPMAAIQTLPDFESKLRTASGDDEDVTNEAAGFNIWFLLKLLYDPQSIGLTSEDSIRCGSPALNFNPRWGIQVLWCYDNVFEEIVLPAYIVMVDNHVKDTPSLAPVAEILKLAFISTTTPSYAHAVLGLSKPGIHPEGKIPDNPLPNFSPDKGYDGWCSAQIPESWLAGAGEDVLSTLFQTDGQHVTGGNVGTAHDQMSAVTPAARRTGLSSTGLSHLDHELQRRILAGVLEDSAGAGDGEGAVAFPGMTEVNHVCVDSFGPLRSNLTELCPSDYSLERKEAECLSVQESIWGTVILDRLERIKAAVDPDNIFDCYPCVKPKKNTASKASKATKATKASRKSHYQEYTEEIPPSQLLNNPTIPTTE